MVDNEKSLKIAVVGCGQIADAHLKELEKIDGARVVAACDSYFEVAERARLVYGLDSAYSDLGQMLDGVRPDVVHITTPPATHKSIAIECLNAGCHVYVEKPFALDAEEAQQIISAGENAGLKLCVGHNELFDPVWQKAQSVIRSGVLGDIVHIDSIQGFDMSGPFGSAIGSDKSHWVRKLPGGIFQNTISHPLYKVTDCLPDWMPKVRAYSFTRDPQFGIPTELRVEMESQGISARLHVSSSSRPVERYVRIHGSEQSIEVDFNGQTIKMIRPISARGPFVLIQVPLRQLGSSASQLAGSIWRFVRNDIHYSAGMNTLFRQFYSSIRGAGENPIGVSEIMRVTQIMDNIFVACSDEKTLGWVELQLTIQAS